MDIEQIADEVVDNPKPVVFSGRRFYVMMKAVGNYSELLCLAYHCRLGDGNDG
jgi:hypothetical protein